MKNRDKAGDAILTDSVKNDTRYFITLIDVRALSKGIRNLQLYYASKSQDQDEWFVDLLPQLIFLFLFLDELEEEYDPNES